MTVGGLEKALAQIEDKSLEIVGTAEAGYVITGVRAVYIWRFAGADTSVALLAEDLPKTHGRVDGEGTLIAKEQ